MKTATEQKRHYEQPRMRVVELKHHPSLLAGSPGGLSDPDDYPNSGNPFTF